MSEVLQAAATAAATRSTAESVETIVTDGYTAGFDTPAWNNAIHASVGEIERARKLLRKAEDRLITAIHVIQPDT